MKARLYQIGESYFLQKQDGMLNRINSVAARHFLLNFMAPEYSEGGAPAGRTTKEYEGDIIAELTEHNYLLVKNADLFKALIDNTAVTYVSVTEYAQEKDKSPAMVRRHCQNGKIEGVILTPGGYVIPKDAVYPFAK